MRAGCFAQNRQMETELPHGSGEAGVQGAPYGPPRAVNPSPPTVLVVAADLRDLQSIQASLANPSVSVVGAETAPGALALLQTQDVTLALVDVQLPGMDGYALARAMRASARSRHVPIVFLIPAGHDVPAPLQALGGGDAGAIDFLYKPVDALVLTGKVKLFCDLHRQHRLLAQRLTELDRASRLNGLMLAALSHDLRTPLASLLLNAEIVVRRADSAGLRQAGERIKLAVATMGRQVDHLVNLSHLPSDSLRPDMAPGDLGALTAGRVQAARGSLGESPPITWAVEGDTRATFDASLLSQAVDQLLLLSNTHGNGQTVTVTVNGHAHHAVNLQIAVAVVLAEPVRLHLFGGGPAIKGLPASRVGPGLDAAERIARAHGGSLIGRSREPDGTLFELMLPRSGHD